MADGAIPRAARAPPTALAAPLPADARTQLADADRVAARRSGAQRMRSEPEISIAAETTPRCGPGGRLYRSARARSPSRLVARAVKTGRAWDRMFRCS